MFQKSRVLAATALVASMSLSMVSIAAAQTANTTMPATSTTAAPAMSAKMTVTIGPKGQTKLEGTLASMTGTTLMVNSWGGVWSVDASNAKFWHRYGGVATLSQFMAGDQLTLWGTASASGWMVTASKIQDMSLQTKNVAPYGVISNLSSTGLTLAVNAGKSNEKDYTVTWDGSARVWLNGKAASATDLQNGMKAVVRGLLDRTGMTIMASRIEARTVAPMKTSVSANAAVTASTTMH